MPKVLFSIVAVAAAAGVAIALSQVVTPTSKPDIQATPVAERATVKVATDDSLSHPPVRQDFSNGPYQLVITAEDRWETPLANSTLYEGDSILWEQDLPHQYGPRFVLVGRQGQVLLLDEFINVASPHAVTLIAPDGEIIQQSSFEDIQKTLRLRPADLTRQATSGWWISAAPELSSDGRYVFIKTGGTTLKVNMNTGELRRHADL